MSPTTIEKFFTGKTFVIPGYQRDYAWTERNVNDLFDDVEEALEAGGSHYLGTFILSRKDRSASVYVVDGQQRLTTLTMLLDVLIDAVTDESIKLYYRNTFIFHPITGAKFRVLGANEEFFRQLLDDQYLVATTDGQERLKKAHSWIRQRVLALLQSGGQTKINKWLRCISELEVLEFIEADEGKAIRMFQSVNDRGVPLAKMDIVKSLLVYYSNRYLAGDMDEYVAKRFGEAFIGFSAVKRLAREKGYQVRNIDRDSFREDDVLRYHYFAFDGSDFNVSSGADYNATSETVLEEFLKPALKRLRADPERLRAFITRYTDDLVAFFHGLHTLIQITRTDRKTYLLLVTQDLAATLYPLVIRLYLKGWLSEIDDADVPLTLQDLIEIVDLRVFKLRGTNPQADIARITRELPISTVNGVAAKLKEFCKAFMSDALTASRLVDDDMYRNVGLPRMLVEVDEDARRALHLDPLSIPDLVALNQIG